MAPLSRATRALVERFFELLGGMRPDEWIELWAEDGVFEQPYAPPGFPARLEGVDAIYRHIAPMERVFESFAYRDLELHGTEDPDLVVGTVRSEAAVLATRRRYDNRYVVFFRVREGRIAEYREFYDPLVVLESFGDADALNAAFGVPPSG